MNRRSKNAITIEQLTIACRHLEEQRATGMTMNFAIRALEFYVDHYCKYRVVGNTSPHCARDCRRWSTKATKLRASAPDAKAKEHFVVEHGTPRRALALIVLDCYRKNSLTSASMDELVTTFYQLAVITKDENEHLNSIARSKLYETPFDRWRAAGIEFDTFEP